MPECQPSGAPDTSNACTTLIWLSILSIADSIAALSLAPVEG